MKKKRPDITRIRETCPECEDTGNLIMKIEGGRGFDKPKFFFVNITQPWGKVRWSECEREGSITCDKCGEKYMYELTYKKVVINNVYKKVKGV